MATKEVAEHPVTATVAGEGVAPALDYMLRDFNFVQFVDTRSGRSVYLVTSLADPNAPRTAVRAQTPAVAPAPAMTQAIAAPETGKAAIDESVNPAKSRPAAPGRAIAEAGAPRPTQPRSLDELTPIAPAAWEAYGDQATADAEMARVRQQTLDRANAVLGNPAYGPELQRQALNDIAGIGDPRSVQTLQSLINDSRVADSPAAAETVAQAAWRYAAQQQFTNAQANQLLQSMANSTQPQIRSVGEAAVRDSQNYLARNPKP
jgi:hypothetical protein